tara:strand:+ start:3053 stop:4102 length:1050 start_codon:yes stop_codon:yes gene_type:complete
MPSFKKYFLEYCNANKFEENDNQIEVVDILEKFIKKKSFFSFFYQTNEKNCFYLFGDVGVGKTMILDNFYNYLKISKLRTHFNEFMIRFHDFKHEHQEDATQEFVKSLKKKFELIYLDEFQVTNIVDAMILGKLFESIFKNNIKILISSNSDINDLYKDGLQRDQFLPFINLIEKNSLKKKLVIGEDYRKLASHNLQRVLFPLNEKNTFKTNQFFRELTKNKIYKKLKLIIKGREFTINDFYEGVVKFDFIDLCDANLGAEDYIKIAESCKFIVLQKIPNFHEYNINQQQRFITLIDILYEKKVPLMILCESPLEKIKSSERLSKTFRRTISRLFELTSPKHNFSNKVV